MNNAFAIVVGVLFVAAAGVVGFILGGEALLILRKLVQEDRELADNQAKQAHSKQIINPGSSDTNPLGVRRPELGAEKRRNTVERMINFFEEE